MNGSIKQLVDSPKFRAARMKTDKRTAGQKTVRES